MLKKYGIDGIYVIHAKNGYEYHKKRLRTILDSFNLKCEFVTDGDPSLFPTINLERYFTPEALSGYSSGAISCTLNHIISYEKVVTNNIKYAVIFENDPFFIGNFLKKIIPVAKEADLLDPGFIISLENSTLQFPSFWQIRKDRYLYPASCGRFAGAYMIDFTAAKAALESIEINKCNDIIDWWHNRLIDRGVLKMYWAHPPLTEQGSHNGLMSSTISSKQKKMQRRILWNVQKFFKLYIRRLGKQKRLINS